MKRLLPLAGLVALPALAADCPDLTTLQRAAGYVTWQNTLQVAAITLGAAGTLFFCAGLVRRFLQHTSLIEALLWLLALGGIAGGLWSPADHQTWPVLFGALVLPGAAAFTLHQRRIAINPEREIRWLTLIWGAVALLYQQEAVGFLTVAAALSWLGLRVGVAPFCYFLGFKDGDALVRGTVAGAMMVCVFMVVSAAGFSLGTADVFQSAALWLGSYAWFLGVLIWSVRAYRPGHYTRRQLVAVVSLVSALSAGLLLAVREVSTMAGAFLIFYLVGKVAEIPMRGSIGFGLKLLAVGVLLGGLWVASGYMDTWLLPALAAAR